MLLLYYRCACACRVASWVSQSAVCLECCRCCSTTSTASCQATETAPVASHFADTPSRRQVDSPTPKVSSSKSQQASSDGQLADNEVTSATVTLPSTVVRSPTMKSNRRILNGGNLCHSFRKLHDICRHSYAVDRGLVVGFCAQPLYCYRPYCPAAKFPSPSSYMVSDEPFPDRSRPMSC